MQTSLYWKHSIATMLLLFIFTCCGAQNVGIGTTAPKARLHVADSSVLFSGSSPLPAVAGLPPITGAGTRLMWYPAKAAIRAGGVSGVEWNETNIGQYSTAFGRNTIASGQYSTSFGVGSTVTGHGGATALGSNNVVSGNAATGIGFAVTAQSYGSLVIGRYNTIAGNPTSWVDTDPLFVVGNGYLAATRRNAFSISKNGDTRINGVNSEINGNLTIGSTTPNVDTATINAFTEVNGTIRMQYNNPGGALFIPSYFRGSFGTDSIITSTANIIVIEGGWEYPDPNEFSLTNGIYEGQTVTIINNMFPEPEPHFGLGGYFKLKNDYLNDRPLKLPGNADFIILRRWSSISFVWHGPPNGRWVCISVSHNNP